MKKNIILLPTSQPSKLYVRNDVGQPFYSNFQGVGVNIFITNDEKPKDGDWCYSLISNQIGKVDKDYGNGAISVKFEKGYSESTSIENYKKIILATGQDLVPDGVQAIDDSFIEWFIKNPTCEFVDLEHVIKEYVDEQDAYGYDVDYYKIIIPKQEQTEDSGIFSTSEIDELVSNEDHSNTPSFTEAIDLIAQERLRQVNVEGWSEKHDAEHTDESIALAAACYATPHIHRPMSKGIPYNWIWDRIFWKPTPNDRIKELVKAGALIVAEIERLQRKEK